jgi:Sulfatase-modifying factor enzyme 1
MKVQRALPFFLILALSTPAYGDTFGSGANTFDIDFTTIGSPGNADDPATDPIPSFRWGSVPYVYQIGTFEISEQMIDKVNAMSAAEGKPLNLGHDNRGANKPATSISWNEAGRFINWLNTSTGNPPAYRFGFQPGEPNYNPNQNFSPWLPFHAGYNPNNIVRNSLAKYFLPSVDEWHKAAFYDPSTSTYYGFATGSNSAPTPVASGTAANTAVYGQLVTASPADITLAGGLSAYGTMAQGGNVNEWDETEVDLVNDGSSPLRGWRGGSALHLPCCRERA